MTQDQALSVFKDALMIVLKIGGPILAISILIGLVVSILQAATQVHEQTLSFVPKLLAIAALLLFAGGWMMNTVIDFAKQLFELMATLGK